MAPSNWLEIDLRYLDRNVASFRSILAGGGDDPAPAAARLCAVVKADAYGTGAVSVARRLVSLGVEMLAVYNADQGRQLVEAGIDQPLLVLGPMIEIDRDDPLYAACSAGQLHLAIHSPEDLDQADALGRACACRIPIHPHLDTGMTRGGVAIEDFGRLLERVRMLFHVELVGLWTHMASSDDEPAFTEEQCRRFDEAVAANRQLIGDNVIVHIANTFTTLRGRRYHRDMVRIGLGLYGFGPELLAPGPLAPGVQPLAPVARWCSRIAHVHRWPKGAGVGYNQTFHLERDSVLGVVPVGYADGYHLSLSNKGIVALPELAGADQHASAPLLGKVNMDQIVIDLTDLSGAQVGSLVEIYSNDPTSPAAVPALAQLAGSHPYDMLTAVSTRVPRRYWG